MLESRRCLLPARLTHGPSLLGILTATLTLLIHSHSLSAQQSYSGQGSYAIYPGWTGLDMEEGLLQLTFRTVSGQGLLLYADGDDGGGTEALAVMLQGGRISVKIQRYERIIMFGFPVIGPNTETEQIFVSENLTDNMPHTLSLQRSAGQVTVSVLDRSASESSRLLSRFRSSIGSMKVYIGGLPRDVTSLFSTSGHFSGCLEDIQFANNSANASSLVSVSPLIQEGIMNGCFDPCVNVSCGGGAGRCVAVPSLPDRYFCDCSSTPFGGANCSEDLSMHRLNLTLDSHLCYALDNFPLINSAASVRLLAPLPQTGTIMTGVSSTGDQFNLYLEESILKFELISSGSIILIMGQVLEKFTSYQVDFEIGNDRIELILSTVSGSVIERLNGTVTFPVATFFTTVCVGGTMLEIPYYVGLLERVIYNAVPLSDQSLLQPFTSVETPVNLISISEDFIDPPLTFQRFNFANFQRITFEMRLKQDTGQLPGTPFASSGGDFEIQFSTFNGQFAIFGSNGLMIFCTNTPTVDDNEWHRIDLTLSRIDNGTANMSLTVDESSCYSLTDSQLGELLSSLTDLNAPLRFGVTRLASDTVTVTAKFIGCFRNIEFRETADSEPVSPDLASVIRSKERFSTGEEECYTCMTKTATCQNGEVCADCGFSHPAQCLDSLNSCPAPSSTPTPTTTSSTQTSATVTSQTPTPETTGNSTSSTNSTSTSLPGTTLTSAQLGLYIGIAVGGAVAIIIFVVIIILLLCFCVRIRAGGQGFYKTEESNGKAMTMLHYSASLRQIASEQVTMAETNGVSPMHVDGLRAKEFYM